MNKFCAHCGAELVKDANFCISCGKAIHRSDESTHQDEIIDSLEERAEQNDADIFYQPPRNESTHQVYVQPEPPKVVSPKDAITSMVFGIVSIFMAIFSIYPFAIIAFMPASIVFICLAKVKARRYLREAGREIGFARAGRITSTVAIPLLSFFSIYGLAFTILFIQEII